MSQVEILKHSLPEIEQHLMGNKISTIKVCRLNSWCLFYVHLVTWAKVTNRKVWLYAFDIIVITSTNVIFILYMCMYMMCISIEEFSPTQCHPSADFTCDQWDDEWHCNIGQRLVGDFFVYIHLLTSIMYLCMNACLYVCILRKSITSSVRLYKIQNLYERVGKSVNRKEKYAMVGSSQISISFS